MAAGGQPNIDKLRNNKMITDDLPQEYVQALMQLDPSEVDALVKAKDKLDKAKKPQGKPYQPYVVPL